MNEIVGLILVNVLGFFVLGIGKKNNTEIYINEYKSEIINDAIESGESEERHVFNLFVISRRPKNWRARIRSAWLVFVFRGKIENLKDLNFRKNKEDPGRN